MSWANAPAATQSFFLHMHDLDLARNKTTDDQAHWVLWNLPAATTGLPEGAERVAAPTAVSDQRHRACIAVRRRHRPSPPLCI